MQKLSRILTFPLILAVKMYQVGISPLFPTHCKFHPSCSNYALEALNKYGLKGVWMSVKRISKCHPFSKKSGYDPVR